MPTINNIRLTAIFDSGITEDPLDEILILTAETNKDIDLEFIREIHGHIKEIFSGHAPGFQASSTKYHNLRHTQSVALATIRLVHGMTIDSHRFTPHVVEQCLLSAYFHDTGLVLRTSETADSGASYTKHHEDRSIRFLHQYLDSREVPAHLYDDCATIIEFTNLRFDPKALPPLSKEVELSGQIVGSADILAQMANRYYLESLPYLHQEHLLGGVQQHGTALELMKQTASFYRKVIDKRLKGTFGDVARSMRTHFRNRWQIDQDLYMVNIYNNIKYLKKIIARCEVDPACLEKYLRRKPPPDRF